MNQITFYLAKNLSLASHCSSNQPKLLMIASEVLYGMFPVNPSASTYVPFGVSLETGLLWLFPSPISPVSSSNSLNSSPLWVFSWNFLSVWFIHMTGSWSTFGFWIKIFSQWPSLANLFNKNLPVKFIPISAPVSKLQKDQGHVCHIHLCTFPARLTAQHILSGH